MNNSNLQIKLQQLQDQLDITTGQLNQLISEARSDNVEADVKYIGHLIDLSRVDRHILRSSLINLGLRDTAALYASAGIGSGRRNFSMFKFLKTYHNQAGRVEELRETLLSETTTREELSEASRQTEDQGS